MEIVSLSDSFCIFNQHVRCFKQEAGAECNHGNWPHQHERLYDVSSVAKSGSSVDFIVVKNVHQVHDGK